MKILNTKFGRQAIAAALILSAMASMSLGAFAAEPSAETAADEAVVAGYLPPQDESIMTQGDIALHSSDAQTTAERDPNYGGYAAPVEDPIQGNVMMIAETGDAQTSESTIASNPAYSARYTVKGLLGKQVLYTASVKDQVLTLSVPEDVATFRATVGEMRKLMDNGVRTVVLTTNKASTTLNLSLLCEGQRDTTKVTLRHIGSSAVLHVGLRCRRDLLVGRDSNYGGYASPVENPIQGNVMMISDETPLPSDTPVEKSEARYTVKGLLGKQVLYTARQEGRVLTLDVPDDNATFRTTILDMQTLMNQGVSTLVLKTDKTSTTLNLTLLCQGQKPGTRVTLRHLGSSAHLTVGFRGRRDLIVGR